jgi:hypothetical protein
MSSCRLGGVASIRAAICRVVSSRSGFFDMIKKFPHQLREKLRQELLIGPNGVLPTHIGYFLMWYGAAEVGITTMLALVLDFRNFEKLEFIVRGMDARVKCERLRQASKKYMALGPEIEVRLRYFEKTIVPLRNKIAHSWPYLDETSGHVLFGSVGIPDEGTAKFAAMKAISIHLDDLFDAAAWVHLFAQDVHDAIRSAIRGGALEVANPQSDRPKEFPKDQPPKARHATTDKRVRKPQRTSRR